MKIHEPDCPYNYGHNCSCLGPMTKSDNSTSQSDTPNELDEAMYQLLAEADRNSNWQMVVDKHRPVFEALLERQDRESRNDEHIQTARLLNKAMQNEAGYDKPITPEDIRNVMFDRYEALKSAQEDK